MADLAQQALRAAAIQAVGPTIAPQLQWSTSAIPTITNVELLRPLVEAYVQDADTALRNPAQGSGLDNAEGNWEPLLAGLAAQVPHTLEGMSQAFNDHILPLGSAVATRNKNWRNWRTVLTWATARWALGNILPMPSSTLRALLWEVTSAGGSKSVVKSILDAVIAKHREAGLESPLSSGMTYSRLNRCLGRLLCKQQLHKLPITLTMVVKALRLRPINALQLRNKLTLAVATIGIMRPAEAGSAQTCDYEFDGDLKKGLVSDAGSATLHTRQRKQDQERKGHQMRFGKSLDPELDVNHQMGMLMDMLGTRPLATCTKKDKPHARCKCPPLFPRLVIDQRTGEYALAPKTRPTTTNISAYIVAALKDIGVDPAGFSGVCCRMGGLTIAIEAGVPEHILWMQSGHAQDRAARRYVRLQNPDRLYDTWRAFHL
jgi:hypothetical protein